MFERFTESARRVLFFARCEVTDRGGRSIETEHVLLGLLRERTPMIDRMLTTARLSPEALRAELEQRMPAERVGMGVEIPFSADAKRALELAAREADDLKHRYIAPEHLLLGLLRLDQSIAGATLIAHGVRLNDVREAAAELPPDRPAADGIEMALGFGVELDIEGLLARIRGIEDQVARLAQAAGDKQATIELAQVISQELAALRNSFEALE